jgi:hypothetical protein
MVNSFATSINQSINVNVNVNDVFLDNLPALFSITTFAVRPRCGAALLVVFELLVAMDAEEGVLAAGAVGDR